MFGGSAELNQHLVWKVGNKEKKYFFPAPAWRRSELSTCSCLCQIFCEQRKSSLREILETKKHLILIWGEILTWLVQSKSLFTAPALCRSEECWRTDWSSSLSNRDTDSEKLAWDRRGDGRGGWWHPMHALPCRSPRSWTCRPLLRVETKVSQHSHPDGQVVWWQFRF